MRKLDWLILGDLHIGHKGDHQGFRTIQRSFFDDQLFPFIREKGVKTLIMLGDFFDRRKFVNFETLKFAKEAFFDVVRELGIETHMIIGNHDTYYKNTNKVNSIELVVNKEQYPNIHVYSSPETVTIDDVRVLMLPWICQENYSDSIKAIKDTDARFVVGHLELAGFEYHRGVESDRGHCDADLLGRFEAVWSGHYHTKSTKGNIHYLGTPYEMTWADYNDPRGFHTFDGQSLTFHENPNKVFVRIVYNDKNHKLIEDSLDKMPSFKNQYVKVVVRRKDDPILLERFLDVIAQTDPFDLNVIDETNKLIEVEDVTDLPSDTLDIIEQFIQNEVETGLDKQKLLSKIQKIYFMAKEVADDE